jgi:hypothetical protein
MIWDHAGDTRGQTIAWLLTERREVDAALRYLKLVAESAVECSGLDSPARLRYAHESRDWRARHRRDPNAGLMCRGIWGTLHPLD